MSDLPVADSVMHNLLIRTSRAASRIREGLAADKVPSRIVLHPQGVEFVLPAQIQEDAALCSQLHHTAQRLPILFTLEPT